MVINFVVDPSTCLLKLVAAVNTATMTSKNINGCSLNIPSWADYFFHIQDRINEIIKDTLDKIIEGLAGSFLLPPETEPTPNIFLAYQVSSLEVLPKVHILVAANTRVRAIDPVTHQSDVYHDPEPGRQALRPPTTYNLHPDANHFILSEARISDELLHAYLWAYQAAGFRSALGSLQILDANITINLTWHAMDFSIPADGVMLVNMDSGIVRGTCSNKLFLEVSFWNLSGTAQLVTIQNATTKETGFYLQIVSWFQDALNITVQAPQIMLPASVIQDLARSAVNSTVVEMNVMLSTNILWMPAAIAPYVPNAEVQVVHQDGCCAGRHGFMQLSLQCQCRGDPTWPACHGLCAPRPPLGQVAVHGAGAGDGAVAVWKAPISAPYSSPASVSRTVASGNVTAARRNSRALKDLPMHSAVTLPASHRSTPAVSGQRTTAVPPDSEIVFVMFNGDGALMPSTYTEYYSYRAVGECILTPLGYEQLTVTSHTTVRLHSLCVFPNCSGCNLQAENFQMNQFSLLQSGAVDVAPLSDCIDLGSSFNGCMWLTLPHAIGGVTVLVLVCPRQNCTSYSMGNATLNIVTHRGMLYTQCTACDLVWRNASYPSGVPLNCGGAMAAEPGACGTPGPGMRPACLRAYECTDTSLNVHKLLSWVIPVGIVVLALPFIIYYRKRVWAGTRRVASRVWQALTWAAKMVASALAAVWMLLKMWVLHNTRAPGKRCFSGEIFWSLVLSALVQWGHVVAYNVIDPLGIFNTNTLLALGFSPAYLDLTRYNEAFNMWRDAVRFVIVSAAALTSVVAVVRVFMHTHRTIIRLTMFSPVLAAVFAYIIYPILISFKYLISVVPAANPYLAQHPDTVSSLETITGDGLAGIAVAFLINISLLLFASMALGAVMSAWMQVTHDNLMLDTFLAIFCFMIPFIVLIPVLILYHAVSQHSALWLVGWLFLLISVFCGVGFLYLKIHDEQFRRKAAIEQYNHRFLIFGTLFLLAGAVFIFLSLYVEQNYDLVSVWYLFVMMFSTGVCSLTFCMVLRATKAFIIDPARESLPPRWLTPSCCTRSRKTKSASLLPPAADISGTVLLPASPPRPGWFTRWTYGVFDSEEKFRLLCLVLGVPLAIYVVHVDYDTFRDKSAKDMFADMLATLSTGPIVWPDGPTLLDPCFRQYDRVRLLQMWFLLFSCILYLFGLLTHLAFYLFRRRWWIMASSRACIFVGVLFTVACVTVVSTPDYLSLLNPDTLFPSCGPQFDRLVDSTLNLGVGLVQTTMSVVQTAGIILSFLPTFNRVLYTRMRMIHAIPARLSASFRFAPLLAGRHGPQGGRGFLSLTEYNLRSICIGISFMSVFITALPLLVLRQLSQDNDTAMLSLTIFTFWTVPGLWLLGMQRFDSLTTWYVGYVLVYFACAFSVLAVVMKEKIDEYVRTYLTDPDFYIVVFSSICMSSVAIGDVLTLMFGDFNQFDREEHADDFKSALTEAEDEEDDRDEAHRLLGSLNS